MNNTAKQPPHYFKTQLIAWLIAFLFAKYAMQFLPGIGIDYLSDHLHYSAEKIGFLAASYFYPYLLLQIPAGIIIDRFKLIQVTFIAILTATVGMLLFDSGRTFSTLITGRILMGSGFAFGTVSYMRAASIYFKPSAFNLLSGLFGAACMGGSGLIILICAWIYRQHGWQLLLHTLSLMTLFISFSGFYFLREEKKHRAPYQPAIAPFHLQSTLRQIHHIIKQKNNILLLMYNGLAFAPIAVFGGLWGKRYLSFAFHLSSTHATWLISTLFYAYALGGLLLLRYFKTPKSLKWFMPSGTLIALCFFITMVYIMPESTTLITLFIFMSAIGFFSSSFLACYGLTRINNNSAYIATAIAIVNMGDPIFGGIAEPLMGKIIDLHHGNYQSGMMVLVIFWVLAVTIGLLVDYKNNDFDEN